MKKLFFSTLLLLATISLWANSSYYAALKTIATPTGYGTVYAGTTTTVGTYDSSSTSDSQSTTTSGETFTFYAFAQANTGYYFAGWSETQTGTILSQDNPYAISVAASTTAGNTNTKTLYAQFAQQQEVTITMSPSTSYDGQNGGSYTVTFADGTIFTIDGTTQTYNTDQSVNLTANPNVGYKFYAWYTIDSNGTKTYFSYNQNTTDYQFATNVTIGVEYIASNTAIFIIKGSTTHYEGLQAALNAAGNTQAIIVPADTQTTIDGSDAPSNKTYTIGSNITLLIPFDEVLTCYTASPNQTKDVLTQTEYRRLTLTDGAKLIVNGAISVSAQMRAGQGGQITGNGNVNGSYGCLQLQQGTQITINNGAALYAWGFVIGNGQIIAESGAVVYEGFHFPAFRGGTAMSSIVGNSYRVFPINQYYVQNIEAPLTIKYGATEKVNSCVYVSYGGIQTTTADYIGASGLFQLQQGTSLTKQYDPSTDRQIYEIDGDLLINSIDLSISGLKVSSSDYVLPITNNLDIKLHSGTITVDKEVALLADATLTIDQGANLLIKNNVYIYDKDEWLLGKFAYPNQLQPAVYTPTRTYSRTTTNINDATIDINGTLKISGQLYTTAGKANICSTQGTGKIIFTTQPNDSTTTYQAEQTGSTLSYPAIPCSAPQLHNDSIYQLTPIAYLSTIGIDTCTINYANDHWGWIATWLNNDTIYNRINTPTQTQLDNIQVIQPVNSDADYIFVKWDTTINLTNQEITYTAIYRSTDPTTNLQQPTTQLCLYPNPVNPNQTLTIQGITTTQPVTLQLHTITGTPLLKRQILPVANQITLQAPPLSGIYYITITTSSTTYQTKLMVK